MKMINASLTAGLLVVGLAARPAAADLVTYHDQAAFLAATQPGYYLETFDGLSVGPSGQTSLAFAQSGFSYSATTDYPVDEFYPFSIPGSDPGDVVLGLLYSGYSYTFTFTGAPVTAVGGYFFSSDIDGNLITAKNSTTGTDFLVFVSIDGTDELVTTINPLMFTGFTSDTPFNTLTVIPFSVTWVGANDLIVGSAIPSAVPEPSTIVLTAAGLPLVLVAWRRRSARRPNS